MESPNRRLIEAVRRRLAATADPQKARPMQAYMKSALPYHGVPVPVVRRICRDVFSEIRIDDRDEWDATARELYNAAEYREERYAAINLTGHKYYAAWQDPDTVPLYRHLIVAGAWWDLVDDVAIHRIGPILRAFPAEITSVLRTWAHGDDLWLRRSSIIAQVGSKHATDNELLAACIEPNISDAEFFLRKAIGWALRDYAKTDPAWVRRYVDANADRLSTLSRREATKNVPAAPDGERIQL